MMIADAILIALIAAFIIFGFYFGFIHTLGSLLGTIFGIVITYRVIDPLMEHFGFIFGGGDTARVIIFVIAFLIISRLVGLVFWLFERLFKFLLILPFAKSFNRVFGAALGFFEGIFILGAVLIFALPYVAFEPLSRALQNSEVAAWIVHVFNNVRFLLPEDWQNIEELLPYFF